MEHLGTIDKALDVLYHLHRHGRGGVTEVGRALGMPKSTTHRLLASLAGRGFVERDARGRYRPGIALVSLGLGVLDREPVVEAARPILESMAEAAGETVFLAAKRAGRIFVLDKQEGRGFLRASPRIGSEIPLHATAIGKIFLAFDPDLSLGEGALRRYTLVTRTRGPLLRELDTIIERGWAANQDEWIPGLSGIAAPVYRGDRLAAAIAVSGPSARFDGTREREFQRSVLDAALAIRLRLEGRMG